MRSLSDSAAPEAGRTTAIVALLCGVALPLAYTICRMQGREGFWKVPDKPHWPWMFAAGVLIPISVFVAARSLRRPSSEAVVADSSRNWRTVPILLLVAAWGLLAWHVRLIEIPGDGRTWTIFASSPFIMTSEPGGRWSHYLAFRLLRLFGIRADADAVRLASVLAGCFQLAVLLRVAPRVFGSVRDALPWIVFLFVSPTVALYLGYTETTPWAYAVLSTHLLATVLYLRGPMARAPWVEGTILAFAIWIHGSMCFASGGYAFLLLVWLRRPGRFEVGRVLRAGLLAALPFSLLVATLLIAAVFGTGLKSSPLFSNIFGGRDHIMWIAFSEPRNMFHYVFLGSRYWADIGNLLVTACPVLPAVPFALAAVARRSAIEAGFLGVTLAGLLILTFFVNADRGIRSDFDLLSSFTVPAHLIVALGLAEYVKASPGRAFVPVSVALAAILLLVAPLARFGG